MAKLLSCPTCAGPVSSDTSKCPRCGAKLARQYSWLLILIPLIGFALVIGPSLVRNLFP